MRAIRKRITTFLIAFTLVLSMIGQLPAKSVKAANNVSVYYRTHVQTYGWEGKDGDYATWKANGAMSGTSGESKRLEGIEIVVSGDSNVGVQYTTHCQNYGWLPWSANGEMNGTEGESKRLEAIKIQLTGENAALYDIYYRVHAQNYGWLGWAKNGQAAGTAGMSKRLEGIQIVVVSKGQTVANDYNNITSDYAEPYVSSKGNTDETVVGATTSNVSYKTHVQTYGWQGWKYNGDISGTSGESKRLEGINIKLTNQQYPGGITYRTHVQKYGWQSWVSNGKMAGTSGESKRLESIQIYLTGEMANHYDLYYRVHAQTFGWLGWVKNGEPSGTAGYSKRLEAIQIVLVEKNSGAPGNVGGIASNTSRGFEYTSVSQIPENPYYGGNSNVTGGYVDVTDYTYEITPINAPFNNMYFVKTDNPNPYYVRFIDRESKYYDEDRASNEERMSVLMPVTRRFVDVVYEDKATGRVNGGYFFELNNYGTDGGNFVLQQADEAYNIVYYDNYYSYNNPTYEDTSVVVKCEDVIPVDYYFVKYHTDPTQDFFTNLNSAQEALRTMSVYPKNLKDTSLVNESRPYPLLATSPYAELNLNDHYDMYLGTHERSLLLYSYPLVLDSLSYPSVIASIASILEPDCTVEANDLMHWMVDVTYNGETQMYGGAGAGSSDPIFTKYIGNLYTFDGSANDYSIKTLEEKRAKLLEIGTQSEEELSEYRDMITGDTFKKNIGNGAWLRVATEGFGYGTTYTYVYTQDYDGDIGIVYGSEVWVDGRYVNEWNSIELGATFEDYPTATIIVTDMEYTSYYGNTIKQDVAFVYDSTEDVWWAHDAYFESVWYTEGQFEKTPDDMILTHEEVEALDVDKNTDMLPESGIIYDGTVEPGTPFTN